MNVRPPRHPTIVSLTLLLVALLFGACGGDPVVNDSQGGSGGATRWGGVDGRVTTPDGRPISDVSIRPESADTPPQPVPEKNFLTDEQGQYALLLLPGRYTLTFVADGYRDGTATVTVTHEHRAVLNTVLDRP